MPGLAVIVVELLHLGERSAPSSDWALLTVDADRALHLDQAVGAYSRFGFHHPGPVLAYWLAPFWWASGHHYGGLGLGAAVLAVLVLVTMVVAAGRGAGRTAAWATAAVAVFFSWEYGLSRLRETWNPVMAILPLAAVAVVGAALAAGRRWFLPAWVVLATVAVQAHVGSAPVLIGFLGASVAVGVVANRRALRRWSLPLLSSVAVAVVLWAPPLVQQDRPPPGEAGNLTKISEFVTEGRTATDAVLTPHQTWGTVLRPLAATAPLTASGFGPQLNKEQPEDRRTGTREDAVLAVLLAGLVSTVALGIRMRSPFSLALGASGLLAVPATVLATFRIVGHIEPYMVFYAVSVGLVAWIAVATSAARVAARWASRAGDAVRLGRPLLAGVLLAASLLVAAGARGMAPSAELRNSAPTATLGADADQLLRAQDVHRVLLDMSQTEWETAAGLSLYLRERGYDVDVVDRWRHIFGDQSRRTGREQVRLVVTPDEVTYPVQPGDRVVARSAHRWLWAGHA